MLSRFWPSWAPAWSSPWTGFQNILHVVFLASFALSSQSQTSTFFVVSNSIRYSFYRRGLARYLHRHLNILLFQKCGIASFFSRDWRPVHFNLRFHISSASVNLPTFVTFRIMLYLLANSRSTLYPCEVLLSSHEQHCQNTLHSRLSHHTFSSLPL